MYSFRMSFWMVPPIFFEETPCCSATAITIARRIAAGALMVMEVVIVSSGILRKRISMSLRESTATPHIPTSPRALGWSESYPMSVGKWNATDRPVCPWESR